MTPRARRSTLIVIVAMMLASLPLRTLSSDSWLLPSIFLAIALLQAFAFVLRSLGLPDGWTNFTQLITFMGAMAWWWLRIGDPDLDRVERANETALETIKVILENPAPLAAHAGMLVLLVTLMGLLTILADLLLVTTWSPAMAGVAAFSPFLVPALVLRSDLPWWFFPTSAAAWIIMLITDATLTSAEWPRNLVRDPDEVRDRRGARVIGMAAQLAVIVILLAFLAGSWLPTLGQGRWQSLFSGRSGTLTLTDPTIDLQENMRRPSNVEILTYTTTHPGGVYLRMTSLPLVSPSGWHPEGLTLVRQQPESVPGRGDIEASVETDISIGDFATAYLPAPYAPVSYDAPGRWSHDPVSLMIYNTEPNNQTATRDLTYSVASTDQGPSEDVLATATAGVPEGAASTTVVPNDVPRRIIELANRIARADMTDGEKALALQNYLRDPERFTYTLDAPMGMGYDVVSNFLFRERAGYCTHFAASMALMARAVGIPSRVAVGFMPGTLDDGRYVVRAHDMHAWPELYFEDLGWVRYEPTVSIADAPAWSDGASDDLPDEPVDEPTPTPEPEEELEEIPENEPLAEPTPTDVPEATAEVVWELPIWPLLLALSVVLAPAAIRALRAGLRLGRRRGADRIEGIWDELRDDLIDLGVDWPGGTPGEAATALGEVLNDDAAAGVRELATIVERSRFARREPDAARAAELLADVRAAVAADASTAQRTFARIAPKSLWASVRRTLSG